MELRKSVPPAPAPQEDNTRFYADEGGALRSLQPDGTDAPVGGGGSTAGCKVIGPYVVDFADFDGDLNGIPLGDCPADVGDIVFSFLGIVDTDFADTDYWQVYVGDPDVDNESWPVWVPGGGFPSAAGNYTDFSDVGMRGPLDAKTGTAGQTNSTDAMVLSEAPQQMWVKFETGAATPSAGTGRVWAVIYSPTAP